jgi:hypothetical protein
MPFLRLLLLCTSDSLGYAFFLSLLAAWQFSYIHIPGGCFSYARHAIAAAHNLAAAADGSPIPATFSQQRWRFSHFPPAIAATIFAISSWTYGTPLDFCWQLDFCL